MKYKVTAEPLDNPVYIEAETEDEAWNKAIEKYGLLHDGLVELSPTRDELVQRVAELEAALKDAKKTIIEHHEFGHIIRAYNNRTENCDVCESAGTLMHIY